MGSIPVAASREKNINTEDIAQLVRASDCGSEGRGFESPYSPLFPLLAQLEEQVNTNHQVGSSTLS